jgi:hypothetical protein
MFLLTIGSIPVLMSCIANAFQLCAGELSFTRTGVGCGCGGCGVTDRAGQVFLLWMGYVRGFGTSSFVAHYTLLGGQ